MRKHMSRLMLLSCLVLAGCGADGPPQAPVQTGITVSGEARIGVVSR
jgi:predicted small lipoprotein YifL